MVNKVILMGRLGGKPKVSRFDSSIVAKVSIATNEKYKNKHGEMVERTEWHNLVLWGRKAEIAEDYFDKGTLLYVEGKIGTRKYEDGSGVEKYITEVTVDDFVFAGEKKSGVSPPPEEKPRTTKAPIPDDDDLPF